MIRFWVGMIEHVLDVRNAEREIASTMTNEERADYISKNKERMEEALAHIRAPAPEDEMLCTG